MTVKLKNNTFSTLRTSIDDTTTTVVVASGHGARFPSLGVGEYFYATIEDADGNYEIVQVTARSTDTLTVVRASEGTTARTFVAGSAIEMRVTAQGVLDAATDAATALDLTDFGVTASAAELNIMDGVVVSSSEINAIAGLTASSAEINILDGATVTTAEINILDGVTATTAEINILDGVTASTAEINTLDGLTADTSELNTLTGITADVGELNILDGVNISTSEMNILAGSNTASAITLADADRLIVNDAGTMKQVAATTVATYTSDAAFTALSIDEDDMASDSATKLPTQQSVKAYVDAQSGMVRLATKTASASASLDFTEFDASLYSQYVFTISAIRPTTDGVSIAARFSSDGGSTFISTSDYDYSLMGGTVNTSDFSENATNQSEIRIARNVDSDTAKLGLSATLNLYEPSLSASTILGGTAMWERNDGSRYSGLVHGYYQAATVVNAIQFFAQSGTLASGTITMYGLVK